MSLAWLPDPLPATTGARMAATAPMVLMQPTTLCNLDCSYCYLPDRAVARRMPVWVADAVARAADEWSRRHPVTILWHGGEPLAAGVGPLRELIDRFGRGTVHPVRHAVQTNATLVDDRWCELFTDVGMTVSVSVDGPSSRNGARLDRGGRDSTARTLRGVEALRRHGIGFAAIAVVCDPTPERADELYDWFADLGAHSLGVNIEERKGVHLGSDDPEVDGDIAVAAAFWSALARRWRDDRRMVIREFAHAAGYVRDELAGVSIARADRPLNPMPMITWDGEVVPLSPDLAGFTSDRLGAFTVGNLADADLPDLLGAAPRVAWVREALDGVDACRASCGHFAHCRGGQAANKYFETGRLDTTVTAYCRSSKIALMRGLLDHAHA